MHIIIELFVTEECRIFSNEILKTDFGARYVQLWVRSTEPPGEHRYENLNNNNICYSVHTKTSSKLSGQTNFT